MQLDQVPLRSKTTNFQGEKRDWSALIDRLVHCDTRKQPTVTLSPGLLINLQAFAAVATVHNVVTHQTQNTEHIHVLVKNTP